MTADDRRERSSVSRRRSRRDAGQLVGLGVVLLAGGVWLSLGGSFVGGGAVVLFAVALMISGLVMRTDARTDGGNPTMTAGRLVAIGVASCLMALASAGLVVLAVVHPEELSYRTSPWVTFCAGVAGFGFFGAGTVVAVIRAVRGGRRGGEGRR
ncbi:hypothetical protein ACH436_16630 [Isoptericola sp. NPDC019693]|uniref:hypothetical protein n=1 Tax=Isoptericola sp. NPDC019693 TaxID=3364009 RepID=UPI0037AA2370